MATATHRSNSLSRDPLDEQWIAAFSEANSRPPHDVDRQDRLFSLIFAGQGIDRIWTDDDWKEYRAHRSALWSGELSWSVSDEALGYDRFVTHVRRLAKHYGHGDQSAASFVRATGLVWGGIAYQSSAFTALFNAGLGRHLTQLHEGRAGWRAEHIDDDNPAHHWVAAFVAGFAYGALFGAITNSVRDLAQFLTGQGGTMADIRLGNVAARHGALLRRVSREDSGAVSPYDELLACMDQDLRPVG